MLELLDGTDPKNRKFINELLKKSHPSVQVPDNVQVYKKNSSENDFHQAPEKSKSKKKNRDKQIVDQPKDLKPESVENSAKYSDGTAGKNKQKFVPLYSQEGQDRMTVKISGRHVCECQAAKHKLINNCVHCGRVVCDQEGSGPCLFCGHLVCTKEEEEILSRGSKKSEKLRQFLLRDQSDASDGSKEIFRHTQPNAKSKFDAALQHKAKLLEYDRTSAKRTQVIDDQSDYYSVDTQWLSKDEKKKLAKREEEIRQLRHGSRLDRKITFDFAGRRVLDAEMDNTVTGREDAVVQEIYYGAKPKQPLHKQPLNQSSLINPHIGQVAPKFVATEVPDRVPASSDITNKPVDKRSGVRLQDRELQEMSDEGMCLSMHQPWASLLVQGIKMHEGRSWYSPHRGRLWIAATSKSPEPEVIATLEQEYRLQYQNCTLNFPKMYPTGCLLGCVDVQDVLPQDQYREKFPDGESSSPYVFICESPQELVLKFPIKGKHKIYKLEANIHQAAKKGLKQVATITK
ncbi:activating signal cointegrator 1-like isoform X2 [Lingula anatina]|nr:activating signal cointegrator 1-like isoform X2 [Lingula anatina]|eukprot:XP_023931504.1 activating signal cointegrator 1-like isoform X2 [Lingula anatina]